MIRDGGSFRSWLLGSQRADDRLVDALESQLEGTESVQYRLTSSGGIVYERGGETHERGKDGSILAVTDRKLVLVLDTGSGVETAEIPYTDLRKAETDGLVRTTVSISVWGRGTLRFVSRRSDDAGEAVAFVSDVSGLWQRAVAALQDARQHISELSARADAGEMDAADEAQEAAQEKIDTARMQADAAPDSVGRAIDESVATVERGLSRARVEARLRHGESLATAARDLTEANRYNEAYRALERAQSQLGTALRIALEWNLPEADRIRSARESLSEQLAELGSKPMGRAERALERARGAGTTHEALCRWEHALECYRDALTAGWGTGAFDGDADALRVQVAWLVGRVLRLHRRLADRYESEAEAYLAQGARPVALDRYETACFHLAAAERLARQYRAGDAGELRERRRKAVASLR